MRSITFGIVGIVAVAAALLLASRLVIFPAFGDPDAILVPIIQTSVVDSLSGGLPLRAYTERCGLTVGAAVDIEALRNDSLYQATLAREFDMLTPENAMKFRELSPELGQYDFSDADLLVDFARSHDMQVRGHTLVWHQGLPRWLQTGDFTPAALESILLRHIHTLVGRYQGQITLWDVVNEAVDFDGEFRDTLWMRAMGKDYIEIAFWAAHQADPDARLFYSDYDNEALNAKSDAIYNLMKDLLARGVPVDGVAFHLHVGLNDTPNWSDVQRNIQRLQDLGLEVQITEMDVRIQDGNLPLMEKLAQQSTIYGTAATICLQSAACTSFSIWGFTDRYTWIPNQTGNPDFPLLFDVNYQPKPAYTSVRDALRACCTLDGGARCSN